MKIKNKLLLGFGLLFIVILLFGVVSLYYIEQLSETSNIALKNNYETLTFTRDMRSVLDEHDLPLTPAASATFDNAQKKQEKNITEHGENEATGGVRKAFDVLTSPSSGLSQQLEAERNIRLLLKRIDGLNLQAIVLKNNTIRSTVIRATLYLEGIGFITFFILFIFIANFPGFILNPLNRFRNGIHQISQRNYDIRLDFKTGDEFAELANEFNTMAARLDKWENTDHTRIFAGELRINALIKEMPDAVIGINEKDEVLFMNTAAIRILNLGDKPFIGQSVKILPKGNLLKMIVDNKDTGQPLKTQLNGKTASFQQKNLEISVPNLKPDLDSLQFAAYPAGMIYVLKNIEEI